MAAQSPRFQHPPTSRGYSPYEVVSALQKAIRRSQPQAAVYWAIEMWESGHGPWLISRLKEILSEDIGPSDRYLPATIYALLDSAHNERKKKGGGGLQITHATLLMATAQKTRVVAQAAIVTSSDNCERLEIPDEAFDKHTMRGKRMGRGMEHFLTEAAKIVNPPDDFDWQALHDEYRAIRQRMVDNDPTLPVNPFAPRSAPAERPGPESLQLQMPTEPSDA